MIVKSCKRSFQHVEHVESSNKRTHCNEMKINRFENLSNELFDEIFEYLDGCSIFKAFTNLNIRFNNLIRRSTIPLKFIFDDENSQSMRDYCEKILCPNAHRLISLHFNQKSSMNSFFNHCSLDTSFRSLKSIVLGHVSSSELLMMIFYLKTLPRLHSLTIHLDNDHSISLNTILCLLFSLPVLKSLQLTTNFLWDEEENRINLSESVNRQSSSIEFLTLKHPITLNELLSLLKCLPSIRHLNCDEILESNFSIDPNESFSLKNFKSLTLKICEMKFFDLENFLKMFGQTIEIFKLNFNFDTDYLEAKRWQRLIEKCLPKLKIFQFYSDEIDFPDSTYVEKYIKPFDSSFWIERQGAIEFEVTSFDMKFSIHQRQNQWFDFHRQIENRRENASNSKLFMELIGESDFGLAFSRNCSFVNELKSILAAVHFQQFRTKTSKILLNVLINLIEKLPHLDSLVLSSAPIIESNYISMETAQTFLLFSMKNRITKLKICQSISEEQIQSLFYLFPRLEYFEIDRVYSNSTSSSQSLTDEFE